MRKKYSFSNINPLDYIRVKGLTKKYLKETKVNDISNIIGPIIPTSMQIINRCNKGARGYYTLLKQADCNDHTMKKKWEKELGVSIDRETWSNIFSICFKNITNNHLSWFQMKILYKILATKSYLFKLRIKPDNECERCRKEETILHMFFECKKVTHFWKKLISRETGIRINFTSFDIIFGYLNKDQNNTPLNALILVTKKYIYDSVLSNRDLNLQILKYHLGEVFMSENLLSKFSNTENIFNRKWGNMQNLFD